MEKLSSALCQWIVLYIHYFNFIIFMHFTNQIALQQKLAEKLNFILKVKKGATPLSPFFRVYPLSSKIFGTLPPSNSIFGRSYTSPV